MCNTGIRFHKQTLSIFNRSKCRPFDLRFFGQTINLGDIEHPERLKHGHEGFAGAVVFDGFIGLGAGHHFEEGAQHAFGAFLDLAAQFLGLLVGQPFIAGVTTFCGRMPQQENIDSGIGMAGGIVARQAVFGERLPRLLPLLGAFFNHLNDGIGDFLADVHV